MPCFVLKCQNNPEEIFLVREEPRVETAVCRSHHELLAEGAEWTFDPESRRIIMGNDLLGTGEYVVSTRPMSIQWNRADPPGVKRLNLEVRRRGSGTSERLELVLSDDARDGIRSLLGD
ncbi:hypothetical protein [Actinoplanes sp. NPDC049118]|uniref:hypothetical protein n=1 Tax=Actinoplanes sp. NPDC049118 TaxID=3155769 RepID=UPI0033DCCA81